MPGSQSDPGSWNHPINHREAVDSSVKMQPIVRPGCPVDCVHCVRDLLAWLSH